MQQWNSLTFQYLPDICADIYVNHTSLFIIFTAIGNHDFEIRYVKTYKSITELEISYLHFVKQWQEKYYFSTSYNQCDLESDFDLELVYQLKVFLEKLLANEILLPDEGEDVILIGKKYHEINYLLNSYSAMLEKYSTTHFDELFEDIYKL